MTNDGWMRFWETLRTMFPAGEQDMTDKQKKLRAQLYRAALDHLSDEEADQAAFAVVRGERSFYIPSVATLLDYARPQASRAIVRASNVTKAQEIYEDIVAAFEGGEVISGRMARERWGQAALDAIAAAGGVHGFQWCETKNEPWRRKAFIETFESVASADPKLALPQLPAPSIGQVFKLSAGEPSPLSAVVPSTLGAKRIDRPAVDRAGSGNEAKRPEEEETTKAMLVRLKEREATAKPITVTKERLAELKRQAVEITNEPTSKAEP